MILLMTWSNTLTQQQMLENVKMHWVDDNDGTIYRQKEKILVNVPDAAGLAFFGTYGGYEFTSPVTKLSTEGGVRGMGFPAWAVFDNTGNGVLFF